MKQKQILGLGAAAVVLMGLAVYLSESRKPAAEAPLAGPLAPGLEAGLNEVKQVVVQAAGGETITLQRGEAGWGVEEKQGYAADVGKLRELLLNLAQAQRIEPKTAVEASYPVLGVQDVQAEGASNVLLRVAGAGPELAVILGRQVTTHPPAKRRRPEPNVDGHVERFAFEHLNQFALRMGMLDVQPPQNTAPRF